MEQKTILIVDDETDVLDALGTVLENAGFAVLKAQAGATGHQLALEQHPDLILMDINMPGMDGHETVAKIREDAWGKNVKVVYLTAYSDVENVYKAVERGSEEYIVKTNMSLDEVVDKCKQVIHGYNH